VIDSVQREFDRNVHASDINSLDSLVYM